MLTHTCSASAVIILNLGKSPNNNSKDPDDQHGDILAGSCWLFVKWKFQPRTGWDDYVRGWVDHASQATGPSFPAVPKVVLPYCDTNFTLEYEIIALNK